MKFWNIITAVLIVCLLTTGIGFGGNFEKETILLKNSSTGQTGTYKIINTLVNGKELDTDVPGYLVESSGKQTVYVPISTIYRSLNASVSWSAKTKKLTIVQGKNTYVIEIGKSYVLVNNKQQVIDDNMPAMLMNYANVDRTMVPVSVIGKQMGMEIKYQPEIRTVNISHAVSKVQGFSYNAMGSYKEIRVKTSGEISTTHYMIDGTAYGGKSKIIVEFQNAIIDQGANTALQVGDKEIGRINLVNPNKTPPRVRLEVELSAPQGYYTYYDKGTKEQVVQVVNALKDIQYSPSGPEQMVQVKTLVKPVIAMEKLENKLVIDLIDTKLVYNNGSGSVKDIKSNGLVNVAYSQFTSTGKYENGKLVSRVVLNFSNNTLRDKAFVKNTKEGIQIYLGGDPDKGINYVKDNSATSSLKFALNSEVAVEQQLDVQGRRFVIKIPKTATTLENIYKKYNDNLIETIEVNTSLEPENYIVTVKLVEGTSVYDVSHPKALSFAFINENIRNSDNQKTLIVLDAGHGGTDPGASGKFTGVKEKDLTLKAVYALKAELERQGYDVALTRTSDTKMELLQRTDFANEINGTLLISIHYNAVDTPTVKGLEVLYYPEATGEREALAKILHSELISATGAKARGIVKRPLLVVPRETKMPSALIEMGFITNKDEEQMVQQDAYLAVQVKAIARAIEKYLSR